jgi:two-component system alkaline phosphatase synthesis response regulator PhoP
VLLTLVKTVLVVDDELPIVEVVAAVLQQEGYQVLTAGDGREALACLENGNVDLVLSDMMMPVMDGRELCKQIEVDPALSSTPIVLMSATHNPASLDGCRHAGFLKKPFDVQELVRAVTSILGEEREGSIR